MRRSTLNFLVDLVSLLVMMGMIATGLVIRFILPPGTGGLHRHGPGQGRQLLLWGMGRHDWGDIHFWLATILGILLLVHLILHWSWVCVIVRRLLSAKKTDGTSGHSQNLYGAGFVIGLIVIFGGFFWLAVENVEMIQGPHGAVGHVVGQETQPASKVPLPQPGHHGDDHIIRGSMTLGEVESTTGVPIHVILSELGLPETVSRHERLGRLKRQYGFELTQVREIVAKYQTGTKSTMAE
ncbi:MAG: DUF4405 domain-containing protein [Planctomycetota bacterium]|nr:MAG: DUF4405 domain-containing protein [Planctomycetota bacterium]